MLAKNNIIAIFIALYTISWGCSAPPASSPTPSQGSLVPDGNEPGPVLVHFEWTGLPDSLTRRTSFVIGMASVEGELADLEFRLSVDEQSPTDFVTGSESIAIEESAFAAPIEGPHRLHLQARAKTGARTPVDAEHDMAFTIDTTAPAVSLSGAPEARTAQSAFTITVLGDDVAGYRYSLDAADTSSWRPRSEPLHLGPLEDGPHQAQIFARDLAGNEADGPLLAFTVDTTGPRLSLFGCPAPLTPFRDARVLVSRVDSDGDDFAGCVWRIDNAAEETIHAPQPTLVLEDLQDGTHTLRVRGLDTLGNLGPELSCAFTVDGSIPAVRFHQPDLPAQRTRDDRLDVGIERSSTEVLTYTFRLDGQTTSTPRATNERLVVANLGEGPHTLLVWGQSASAEQPFPTQFDWYVDRTTPAFGVTPTTLPSPTQSPSTSVTLALDDREDWRSGQTWQVSRTAVGPGCAVNEQFVFEVRPDARLLTLPNPCEGNYTLSIALEDELQNRSSEETRGYLIDRTPPMAAISAAPSRTSAASTAFALSSIDVSAVQWTCTVTTNDPSCGPRTFVVNAANDTLLVDNPCVGNTTLSCVARDAADNSADALVRSYEVDRTAPVISLNGVPGSLVNDATTELTFGASEPVRFTYSVSKERCAGVPPQTSQLGTSGNLVVDNTACDGDVTIALGAIDEAGNAATSIVKRYRVLRAAPVGEVQFLAGVPDQRQTQSTLVEFLMKSSTPDADRVVWSVDGGPTSTAPLIASSRRLRLESLSVGTHILLACLQSPFGPLQTTCSETEFVVNTALVPTPSLAGPVTATNADPVLLSMSEAQGTTRRLSVVNMESGRLLRDDMLASGNTVSLAGLAEGEYRILGRATNEAGTSSVPAQATLVIDRTAPILQITAPQQAAVPQQVAGSVELELQTDGTELAYRINAGVLTPVGTPNALLSLPLPGAGWHIISVIARDAAGNQTEDQVLVFNTQGTAAYYVSLLGDDLNDCDQPASPCATLGRALAQVQAHNSEDARILLTSGEHYLSQTVLQNQRITLVGGYNADFSARSGRSLITSNATGVALHCATGFELSLLSVRVRRQPNVVDPLYNAAQACTRVIMLDSELIGTSSYFTAYLNGANAAFVAESTISNVGTGTIGLFVGEPAQNGATNVVARNTITGFPMGLSLALSAPSGTHRVHAHRNLLRQNEVAVVIESAQVGDASELLFQHNQVEDGRVGASVSLRNPAVGAKLVFEHNRFGLDSKPLRPTGFHAAGIEIVRDFAAVNGQIIARFNHLVVGPALVPTPCLVWGFTGITHAEGNQLKLLQSEGACVSSTGAAFKDVRGRVMANHVDTASLALSSAQLPATTHLYGNQFVAQASNSPGAIQGNHGEVLANDITAGTCWASDALATAVVANEFSCSSGAGSLRSTGDLKIEHNHLVSPAVWSTQGGSSLVMWNNQIEGGLAIVLDSRTQRVHLRSNRITQAPHQAVALLELEALPTGARDIELRDNLLVAPVGIIAESSASAPSNDSTFVSRIVNNTVVANQAIVAVGSRLPEVANNLLVRGSLTAPAVAITLQGLQLPAFSSPADIASLAFLHHNTLSGFDFALEASPLANEWCPNSRCALSATAPAWPYNDAGPVTLVSGPWTLGAGSSCSAYNSAIHHERGGHPALPALWLDSSEIGRTLVAGGGTMCAATGWSRGFREAD